jgi:GABA permease
LPHVHPLRAGVLVVLIMRMLGDMAVANPAVGSFVEYCRTALGPRGTQPSRT